MIISVLGLVIPQSFAEEWQDVWMGFNPTECSYSDGSNHWNFNIPDWNPWRSSNSPIEVYTSDHKLHNLYSTSERNFLAIACEYKDSRTVRADEYFYQFDRRQGIQFNVYADSQEANQAFNKMKNAKTNPSFVPYYANDDVGKTANNYVEYVQEPKWVEGNSGRSYVEYDNHLVAIEAIENVIVFSYDNVESVYEAMDGGPAVKKESDVPSSLNTNLIHEQAKTIVMTYLGAEELSESSEDKSDESSPTNQCKNLLEINVVEAQSCFLKLALDADDWKLCLNPDTPDEIMCVVNFADEKSDPSAILEMTAPSSNPFEISIYEDKRDAMLAAYIPLSYDLSSLDLIEDNYVHDTTLNYAMFTAFVGSGMSPTSNYCERLKGNYSDVQDVIAASGGDFDGEEGVFKFTKRTCEDTVSSLRDVRHGTDECNEVIPNKMEGNPDPEDIEIRVNFCEGVRTKLLEELPAKGVEMGIIDEKTAKTITTQEFLKQAVDEKLDVKILDGMFEAPVKESPTQISSKPIPDWVKTNAKWWGDGAIDDDSFVQGIQYMIKEGIMNIPITEQGAGSGSSEIPDWIKTNAKWWAEGKIDDNSFIQGIQYMIKEGIMRI